MVAKAWQRQSDSLIEVQKRGTDLEALIRSLLGWKGGRVVYDHAHGYDLQVDAVFPSPQSPKTVVSATYTKPDTRGHSNENKLQLKVGELALLKGAYPNLRVVLAIGGDGDAWLSYVLKAFRFFFDEVLFLWEKKGLDRLQAIGTSPSSVPMKHKDFWKALHVDRSSRSLAPDGTRPPCSSVRYAILDSLKAQVPIVFNPSLIRNPVASLCMRRSFDLGGAEWDNYIKQQWNQIEMSRNYFNPVEAAVELTLNDANLAYEGGVARDVPVRSLLHNIGLTETRVAEDFVLYSKKLNQPVYIQCKASGGGREQHGKNIQNRTKEQTTRSIFYTCISRDGKTLTWESKRFHWISVLDGDWGVNRAEPLKYIHMLQLAGYDKLICAKDLLTPDFKVRKLDNPLRHYLVNVLDCKTK